jgi:hypothetical protein
MNKTVLGIGFIALIVISFVVISCSPSKESISKEKQEMLDIKKELQNR